MNCYSKINTYMYVTKCSAIILYTNCNIKCDRTYWHTWGKTKRDGSFLRASLLSIKRRLEEDHGFISTLKGRSSSRQNWSAHIKLGTKYTHIYTVHPILWLWAGCWTHMYTDSYSCSDSHETQTQITPLSRYHHMTWRKNETALLMNLKRKMYKNNILKGKSVSAVLLKLCSHTVF